jgi:aminoglycoside 6'-N-acetyltransferase I
MPLDILLLGPGDGDVLQHVAPDVFDGPLERRWTEEFLADPRHHLIVAREHGVVVGMVTGVHYVHPDKAPQLFINEIAVTPSHQRRGIGRRLLHAMLAHAHELGCTEAWLGAEATNHAARRLYERAGGTSGAVMLYSFAV